MSTPPCSPTLCRPLHLDRERIRAALLWASTAGSNVDGNNVLFHEAVVTAAPPRCPRSLQLLVLTRAAILLLPLGGSISISAANITRLALDKVEQFERVQASTALQKSLLLVPESELYHLRFQDEESNDTDYWISSFEPETRVFGHVARACRIFLQRRLLCLAAGMDEIDAECSDQALVLSGQLETLLVELVEQLPALTRIDDSQHSFHVCSHLLLELEGAILCTPLLQGLVLENKTRLVLTKEENGWSIVVMGLASLLMEILKTTTSTLRNHAACERSDKWLELVSSVIRVFGAAIFDSQRSIFERSIFFRTVCPKDLIRVTQGCILTCYRASRGHERSDMWHVLWEELLDAQTALLLGLSEAGDVNESVVTVLIEMDGFSKWLEKMFKRICVGIGTAERYIPSLQTKAEANADGDKRHRAAQLWLLALWRHVTLLDLLIQGRPDVILHYFRAHFIDHVDFYLRSDRLLVIMRTSTISHVKDIAHRLDGLLRAINTAASHDTLRN